MTSNPTTSPHSSTTDPTASPSSTANSASSAEKSSPANTSADPASPPRSGPDDARFSIDVADADDTVTALAAGRDPHVTGKASGYRPTYSQAFEAAVTVLDTMAEVVDGTRRVTVTLSSGPDTHRVPWTAPSEAARQLRTALRDLCAEVPT